MKKLLVSVQEFGDEWPFTVDSGELELTRNRVLFHSGGVTYAINGRARGEATEQGWHDLDEIWRDHPNPLFFKVSVHKIIKLAQGLG